MRTTTRQFVVPARLALPLSALLLVGLACNLSGGNGAESATPTPAGPQVLYRDDFSDDSSGWAVDSDDTGSVGYAAGEYFFTITKEKWFTWSHPEENFSDIRIEVTVRDLSDNSGGLEPSTFGLICNYQDDQNFYYAGFGADGYYAVVKVEDNEDKFLSDPVDNQWVQSDTITQGAASYKLELECAKGQIALFVDGEEIASASDSTYTGGDIGMFVLTFDNPNAEVHFDDLRVTEVE
jgi:hypothetical protein